MSDPAKAAAGIVFSEDGLDVLLVQRNPALRFMGGHHAFPGGRVDPTEGSAHVIGARDEIHAVSLHAVVREIFEESGLLCVRGPLPSADDRDQERLAVLAGQPFDLTLEKFGLHIHADDFLPAGHWVTPPMSPIRFDTRYFVYQHRGPRYESVILGEIVGLEWMRPAEARRRWRAGDIRLSTPIAYVLYHLARLPVPEVLPALCRETHRGDGLTSRFELRCGISIIALETETLPPATHTNCIVVGETALVVIDPGPSDRAEQQHLKAQLDHLIELGAHVEAIVLTHSHRDHVGAVQFLRTTYLAPLWCHGETARQLGVKADRILRNGDVVEIDGEPPWRLRCIHTPGHDPGHLSFLEETTSVLIAGDMVANPGTIIISPELGGDMTQYIESLERLLEYDYRILFPAHGMPVRKPKDKLREQITHRLWREERIQQAVDTGLRDLKSIVAKAYDDVPEYIWPLAEQTARAHLHRLGIWYE